MATIAENISRIQTAKADIKDAIEAKGVSVPSSALIDEYADYIDEIPTGGGQAEQDLINLIERDIRQIVIPDGALSIGSYAFSGCRYLTSVTIPNTVTSIGTGAFQNCNILTSLTLPSTLNSIRMSAFINTGFTSIGSVGSGASLELPNAITNISDNTFERCLSLTSVNIPDSVTSIGNSAFFQCTSLTSATIGSGVTTIGTSAFSGCSNMTTITIKATTPPTLDSGVFNNTNNCPIYVPAESVETYKAASGWSNYADRIQAITE